MDAKVAAGQSPCSRRGVSAGRTRQSVSGWSGFRPQVQGYVEQRPFAESIAVLFSLASAAASWLQVVVSSK